MKIAVSQLKVWWACAVVGEMIVRSICRGRILGYNIFNIYHVLSHYGTTILL